MSPDQQVKVLEVLLEHACQQLDTILQEDGFYNSLTATRLRKTYDVLVKQGLNDFETLEILNDCQGARQVKAALREVLS